MDGELNSRALPPSFLPGSRFDKVPDVSLRESDSDLPWEVFTDRLVFDLGLDEFTKGKAILGFPRGYSPFRNETLFLEDGEKRGKKRTIELCTTHGKCTLG